MREERRDEDENGSAVGSERVHDERGVGEDSEGQR